MKDSVVFGFGEYFSLILIFLFLLLVIFISTITNIRRADFYEKIILKRVFIDQQDNIVSFIFSPKHTILLADLPKGKVKERTGEGVLILFDEEVTFKPQKMGIFQISFAEMLELSGDKEKYFIKTRIGRYYLWQRKA